MWRPLALAERPCQKGSAAKRGGAQMCCRPPAACLADGHYAADIFLNGKLVGSSTAALNLRVGDLVVVRSREVDILGCLPIAGERFGGKGPGWRADVPARTFDVMLGGKGFCRGDSNLYAPTGVPSIQNCRFRSALRLGRLARPTFRSPPDLRSPPQFLGRSAGPLAWTRSLRGPCGGASRRSKYSRSALRTGLRRFTSVAPVYCGSTHFF